MIKGKTCKGCAYMLTICKDGKVIGWCCELSDVPTTEDSEACTEFERDECEREDGKITCRDLFSQDEIDKVIEDIGPYWQGDPCKDTISRRAVLDLAVKIELPDSQTFFCISPEDVEALPSVTPKHTEITLESALDYLHKIGWLQRHDKEMTKFALSLTPKQRTGHWILKRTFPTKLYDEYLNEYKCSECYRGIRCTESQLVNYPYCHCGARMVEPQESGDKE